MMMQTFYVFGKYFFVEIKLYCCDLYMMCLTINQSGGDGLR